MIHHEDITDAALRKLVRQEAVRFAGNRNLGIYGFLRCSTGKRMKRGNRVFFASEAEAIRNGYRPCGNCMRAAYKKWSMDLFSDQAGEKDNLLPYDGTVNYYGRIMPPDAAGRYLDRLLGTIEWKSDEAVIFGRRILTRRKVAWYGDKAFGYTYSNTTKKALPWTPELLELKRMTERISGETFNSCLLNLYHNGEEGMVWHSDAERDLEKDGAIGSMSFGAERRFLLKHKERKETIEVVLEHGSLLVMKGTTQTHWLHRLPPSKKVTKARVNLTFRTIVS